jgi:hypothetical protein
MTYRRSHILDKLCLELTGPGISNSVGFQQAMVFYCDEYNRIIAFNEAHSSNNIQIDYVRNQIALEVDDWEHTHHVGLSTPVYYCANNVRQDTPIVSGIALSATELFADGDLCESWASENTGGAYTIFDPGCSTCSTNSDSYFLLNYCEKILMSEHPCYDSGW